MPRKPVSAPLKSNSAHALEKVLEADELHDVSIPLDFKSTEEIEVPKTLIEQVIGQDNAVEITRKAAAQKRNVLLIGVPGIGKSMLAQAMAEILPVSKLHDVLVYPNEEDANQPKIRVVRAGEGKHILYHTRLEAQKAEDNMRLMGMLFPIGWFLLAYLAWNFKWISDIIYAATLILGGMLVFGFALGAQMNRPTVKLTPKLLIDNANKRTAPFNEATGARAGALLGDVRHDPLQSGGLGTPAHLRVEPGMIHRANGGVLFLDEISTLNMKSQQELLTALQEKRYSITGQSEMSSGAMTRTEPVPCDFVLVAAGNYEDLQHVHPALRSRIRGYGYEVYLNLDMEDTPDNRKKIAQFVAQEVRKDAKIPHFSKEAVQSILYEAKRRAGRKSRLTLKLRDLGGLVRASGDLARAKNHALVTADDVFEARMTARTLEQQMLSKVLEMKKDYDIFKFAGAQVGRVNGLAVFAEGNAGMIMPIEAEVAPAQSSSEGKIIATGKLGEIAREAVQNVSALIKKLSGKDIATHDIHIQFLQSHEGVEGDSASVSVATAVISAMEGIPIRQDIAMTGSLSVRGEVLPVGGITDKVQAAVKAGLKEVIIPKSNMADLVLSRKELNNVKVIPVSTLAEVLNIALVKGGKTDSLLRSLNKLIEFNIAKPVKDLVEKALPPLPPSVQ
ncbi:MAG: ATP-dependent protease LonB [Candidatus Iainarchaeum archaeon]|uniref:Archaeal Lon protease n=1 Tax=Candidatus Iainarchaeum sp. TaxID=3101447 RepID=A0A7T9DJT1_9ARCH|nr:MAG: ATP-dependent protease LonB [Candidatus Diapherotrites archaeon]